MSETTHPDEASSEETASVAADAPAIPELEDVDTLAEAMAHDETTIEVDSLPPPLRHDPSRGNPSAKATIFYRALIRDTAAVRMRLEGKSYPEIATRLKYGHRGNAQRAVQRRLKAMRADCTELATELRQIEGLRLDKMLAAVMPLATAGNLQAVDRVLRIQERRAAYEGLDQPKGLKVELAREHGAFLDRLREEFEDDVFERILAVFAGEYGGGETAPAPPSEGSEEGGGGSPDSEGSPPAPAGA